uniref:Uncharacterized protein n=1 Tax=Anopheles maculatus TaxID=74869 RepID=A0A182SA53_9DIPT
MGRLLGCRELYQSVVGVLRLQKDAQLQISSFKDVQVGRCVTLSDSLRLSSTVRVVSVLFRVSVQSLVNSFMCTTDQRGMASSVQAQLHASSTRPGYATKDQLPAAIAARCKSPSATGVIAVKTPFSIEDILFQNGGAGASVGHPNSPSRERVIPSPTDHHPVESDVDESDAGEDSPEVATVPTVNAATSNRSKSSCELSVSERSVVGGNCGENNAKSGGDSVSVRGRNGQDGNGLVKGGEDDYRKMMMHSER